jgi:hypothetical protein
MPEQVADIADTSAVPGLEMEFSAVYRTFSSIQPRFLLRAKPLLRWLEGQAGERRRKEILR